MKWWYEPEEEMKVYKNEDLCIECKREFFSKPYDHRDAVPGQIGYCVHCDNCLIKDKEKKMEFQRERCFTALNADELKAGDKVIGAYTIEELKLNLAKNYKPQPLDGIRGEEYGNRFSWCDGYFALAYLIERAENCTNCIENGRAEGCKPMDNDKLTHCWNYKPKTEPRAEKKCEDCTKLCKGYAKANECVGYNEKHYRPFANTDELIEEWNKKLGCRDATGLVKPYIWVRSKFNKDHKGVLISNFFGKYVLMNNQQCFLSRLFEEYTFLDGSVCGVEE